MHRQITVVVDDTDRISSFTLPGSPPFLWLEDVGETGGQVTITIPTLDVAERILTQLNRIEAELRRRVR